MIPARNESAVIAKTLHHITHLDYPKELYEVVVVTDEKEQVASDQQRQITINNIVNYLNCCDTSAKINDPISERLLYGLISYLLIQSRFSNLPKVLMRWLKTPKRPDKLHEAALLTDIIYIVTKSKWILNRNSIYRCISRYYPNISTAAANELFSRYLALCLPVIETVTRIQGRHHSNHYREELISRITRVRRQLTRAIILELIDAASDGIGTTLHHIQQDNQLSHILNQLYSELLPTTQQIIENWEKSRTETHPVVLHKIVPSNFNGFYKGQILDRETPSTKGRALNYALPSISPKAAMCGFYDAESRPDRHVLLHVAWRCLKGGSDNRILQGPIFQVRNFFAMRPISRIASLYQSATHNWSLPVTFKKIPFVGGTNVFISCDLLSNLKGYDHLTLTEDLEIGTRAWLDFGVWPEYLPCASSEQTPPVFSAYFRQRLRWGTGHLQVMEKIRSRTYLQEDKEKLLKALTWKGPTEWVFYQTISIIPITVWVLFILDILKPEEAAWQLRLLLTLLSCIYFGFTYFCYYNYRSYIDLQAAPRDYIGKLGVILGLLLLPLAALCFPLPFSSALILKRLNRHPKQWVKTPRTQE